MGVDECIDYRQEDFAARTLALTNGRGVELILDAVGGKSFSRGYGILAPTGRLGMFGMSAAATGPTKNLLSLLKAVASMPLTAFNPVSLMNQNKAVFGVNMGHLWDEAPMVSRWMNTLLDEVREGALAPQVDCSFPFEQAAEAHRYIQERRNFGKVLLTP